MERNWRKPIRYTSGTQEVLSLKWDFPFSSECWQIFFSFFLLEWGSAGWQEGQDEWQMEVQRLVSSGPRSLHPLLSSPLLKLPPSRQTQACHSWAVISTARRSQDAFSAESADFLREWVFVSKPPEGRCICRDCTWRPGLPQWVLLG